jgi:hypothetical protein
VGDVEGVTNLVVTGASSNTGLVSAAGISITGTAGNRAVTVTPQLNQFGSTIITLVVRDLEGASASNSFNLTVRPVNRFPDAQCIE